MEKSSDGGGAAARRDSDVTAVRPGLGSSGVVLHHWTRGRAFRVAGLDDHETLLVVGEQTPRQSAALRTIGCPGSRPSRPDFHGSGAVVSRASSRSHWSLRSCEAVASVWPPFHGSMAFHMEGADPVHHPAIARSFTTRTLPRTSRIAETYSRITPLGRFTAVVTESWCCSCTPPRPACNR